MSEAVDCVVVDSHPVVRFGVRRLLGAQGIDVVAEASTLREGQRALARELPQVLVSELSLPDGSGLALVEAAAAARTAAVLFAAGLDATMIDHGRELGVRGFVSKQAEIDVLADAIYAAHQGRTYICPRLAAELARGQRRPRLSEHQRLTLALLANGRSLDEIAAALGVGTETVRSHIKTARRRLGARTASEAVAHALRDNLIT